MTKITNENDELVEVAIFEPNTPADNELVVTDSKAAEADIKTALDAVDGVKPETPPYTTMVRKLREIDANHDQLAAKDKVKSDGSTASYYELPPNAEQLQELISHRNMNAQMGEIFRECYRYGLSEHCDMMRGAKKIKFYADAEIERLEKYED